MTLIRRYRISLLIWVTSWLRPHWRTADRITLYKTALKPFGVINDDYLGWRDEAIIKANVTGETIALEWYLNRLFDSILKRITIKTNTDQGLQMGIRGTEPTKYQTMGIRGTEPTKYKTMTRVAEDPDVGFYDFGVTIPAAISAQEDDIKAIINQFRLAGKKYIIIVS